VVCESGHGSVGGRIECANCVICEQLHQTDARIASIITDDDRHPCSQHHSAAAAAAAAAAGAAHGTLCVNVHANRC